MLLADSISMMVFLAAVVLFLCFEMRVAVGLLVKKTYKYRVPYTRRKWARIAAGAGAVLAIAAAIDGFLIEPDWVVQERLTFSSDKLKKKIRIVQLSDLHTEGYGKRQERALEIVRSAGPDIIVLTGDYLNGRDLQYLPELRRFVEQLEAPLGIYAVDGNFEFSQQPFEMFEEIGIRVLENEAALLEETGLHILGLRCVWDLQKRDRDFLKSAAAAHTQAFTLVLTHWPNHIEEPEMAAADLYLCGHTHGGQVRLPLWGAIVTLSKLGKKYECGHYTRADTHVYVNRGLGMEGGLIPRVRFLCRPEVTVIDLVPATKPGPANYDN